MNVPKVAVIGCGYWGKNLVRNFAALNTIEMICDVADTGRDLASNLAPGISVVKKFDEVLKSDVTGVVIATPAITHYQLALEALSSGKDVFVEKPLAISLEQGSRLVEEAESNGQILMVGHVLEYHPAMIKLLSLIEEGLLGKVQYIYSNRLSLGKIRREENILWSFAPHDIAVILRIMGKLPFQVVACGGGYIQPNIADVTVTNLLFDNGIRAHIYVSWLHPFKEQRLVVIGSRKMVSFDDVSKKLRLFDQRVELEAGEPVPIKNEGKEVSYEKCEPLRLECEAFLQAVKTRIPPLTDGRSGLDVLRVLHAAQRSLILNGQQETLAEIASGTNGIKVIRDNLQKVVSSRHTHAGNGHGSEIRIINS